MSLCPCRSCSRHVRASEVCCPFCASALEPLPPRDPLIEVPLRLGRSALAALAAGTLYACTSQQPAPPALVVQPQQQLVPAPPVELTPAPPPVELTPSPPMPAPPVPTPPPPAPRRPPIVRPVEPPPDIDPVPMPAYGAPPPEPPVGRS